MGLYYEAHITVEPVFDGRLAHLGKICNDHEFRLADLLMQKSEKENPKIHDSDCFCSARDENFEKLRSRTISMLKNLEDAQFKIRRYKIEDTIIDSRHGHTLSRE